MANQSDPKREMEIFGVALEHSGPTERAAYLKGACGDDAELRTRIEALIAAHENQSQFLPESEGAGRTEQISTLIDEVKLTEEPGTVIGRYKLLEKIGEGGFGSVWAAEQREPVKRRVALKIIKLGMDTQQVVARFEAERQALALMDHPNIAKVLDAGSTDTGRPYFVMELVKGIPITRYCEQEKTEVAEKLDLFIKVCHAIQHAHQKGIIHRDIKPSNILVTLHDGVPVPKVIDFGIAKATQQELTELTIYTQHHQFIGTPAYMSPEQAEMSGLDIDTRSDIYSLGVLLYELLTGSTPFDTKELMKSGLEMMRKIIREREPVRPSTRLSQTLSNSLGAGSLATRHSSLATDLDWIVMKCLEKDRTRRYETANGLAADIKRHLANEPIVARPPSAAYRFQKAWRRNRVIYTSGIAITAALTVGLIISLHQTHVATKAEKEKAKALLAEKEQRIAAQRSEAEQTRLRAEAEAEAYTSDMNLALQAWEEGNLGRAKSLLDSHIPRAGQADLRGFEWRYLWNLFRDESLHTLDFGRDDPVRNLASTAAHSFVAVACEKTIRLLEPSDGRELARLTYSDPQDGYSHPLVGLAAGRTNLLVAHHSNGVVGFWDLSSKRLMMTFQPFTNYVGVLALSPDGSLLAVADREGNSLYSSVLEVWNISSSPNQQPTRLWSNPVDGAVTAMSFSPDGGTLVTTTSGSLDWLESHTGSKLKIVSEASVGNIAALAISPDGTMLASAGVEGTIKVWDVASQTLKFVLAGHSSVSSLAFTTSGSSLYSGGNDGTIRRWDIPSHSSSGLWRLAPTDGLTVFPTADDKFIVSAGDHEKVRIWSTVSREESEEINVSAGWGDITVSPDSTSVIVSDPDDVQGSNGAGVWDISSGRHRFDLVPQGMVAKSLAFSPNGNLLAMGSLWKDGLVGIWDTRAWKDAAGRLAPFAYLTNGFESANLCFSADGKTLAGAGLSFPPDQPKVPSGATNRLAFWKVGSWKRLDLVPQAGVGPTEWEAAAGVDFSPDGRFVAVGSRDGWVRLWDIKEKRVLYGSKEFDGVHHWGPVVKFSPDGRWLASISRSRSGVCLWDVKNPKQTRTACLGKENPEPLKSFTFSADEKSLIVGEGGGLIRFWNLQIKKVALTLRHGHVPGGWIAMAPDGTFLVSKDAAGSLKIWRAPRLEEIDRIRTAQ